MELTSQLMAEYKSLFAKAKVRADWSEDVKNSVGIIQRKQSLYQQVQDATGVPWYVVALIHGMESSFNFGAHLHNGDSLNARTWQVPAGRPTKGTPPFTWMESAIDALNYDGASSYKNWSIEGMLFFLERYNGFGYRQYHPGHLSQYLWSGTTVQTPGKYVADGKWDGSAVSAQVGCVAMYLEMLERGLIKGGTMPASSKATWFDVQVAKTSAIPIVTAYAGSEPVEQFSSSSKVDLIAFFNKHQNANSILVSPFKAIPDVVAAPVPPPSKSGWNGKAFADFCEEELKVNKTWSPGIKYVRAFEAALGKSRWAWCGATMHWCWQEFQYKPLGKTLPIRMDGMDEYTFALVEAWQMWSQKKGWYVDNKPGYIPPAGAFVLFDWEQTDINSPDNNYESHIGCFLRMSGEQFICAEGNTDDRTAIKTRHRVNIKGFVIIPEGWSP